MGTSLPDLVTAFRGEAARCAALARTVDHAASLPHLPGWTVGHVLAHLAGDFRWATTIIRERRSRRGPTSVRVHGAALVDAFDRATDEMDAALTVALADPDAPCPNFAEGIHGTLCFWPRRQAHETTMHRWDIEVPTGAHEPVDPDLAADGVDELLAIYTARYGRHVLTTPLTIRCTDASGAWRVDPRPDLGSGRVGVTRIDVAQPGIAQPGIAQPGIAQSGIEGAASSLLLAMSHRLDPDAAGLCFHTDPDVARRFLAGPLTA